MGYAEEAPYDAIHVGAAAPVVPQAVSLYVLCVAFSNILDVENALHTSICKILGSLHCREYQWALWYYCMVWVFVSVKIVGLIKLYVLITALNKRILK